MKKTLLLLFLCFAPAALHAAAAPAMQRTLIAFYDSREESTIRFNLVHRFIEMPANHLGYTIRYHDISTPLPPPGDDMYGAVIWFYGDMRVPDASAYLSWLLKLQEQGGKLIILESTGLTPRQFEEPGVAEKYHKLMQGLGIRDDMDWNPLTYQASIIYKDPDMVEFERKYSSALPAFSGTHVLPGKAISHLRVSPGKGFEPVDLVVTNAQGGYIASEYAIFMQSEGYVINMLDDSGLVQWFVNPFYFLRRALNVPLAPVPDVTTLNGRRIFYSHIDGDGWNSLSEVPEYRKKQTISARVLYEEILKPYWDFPFNVGLITSDVDKECYGVQDSAQVARDIFALPNVEPSSHTHSHPLFWRFFSDYTVEKEKPYMDRYPPRPSTQKSIYADVHSYFDNPVMSDSYSKKNPRRKIRRGRTEHSDEEVLREDFESPRSYACSAYNLHQEIEGSIKTINSLSPPDKKAVLLQWSGNTSPYEEAIAATRKAGFLNINGGDSRFDREYPSYGWVAPIGQQVGNERQIYSSNSNENTYTNLWTGRFFGFRYLKSTVANTESPLRISPFNIYFHVYSAQKSASLKALKDNLEYARAQSLIPITTSHYARIANSFYAARIMPMGPLSWKIENRGDLQTLRVDNAEALAVNMEQSSGVLGFRHFQHALYIALDETIENPLILLKDIGNANYRPATPYLMESSWPIKGLHIVKNLLTFTASGYGQGYMVWQVLPNGQYKLVVSRGTEILFEAESHADKNGLLQLDFKEVSAIEPVKITLESNHSGGT